MTIFFISLFSIIIASFISCLSYRLANSERFAFTRSKCVKCNHELRILNLIPIFSYIFQKGRCVFCHQKISARYIIIELFFLISFLAIYKINNSQIDKTLILYLILFSILATMSIIDIEYYFIPNSLQIFLMIFAVIFVINQYGFDSLQISFISALIFCSFAIFLYLLFYFSANISAIGVDDIKLLFIIGFIIHTKNFLFFIFLTGIFGIIFGSIWIFLKKDDTFPFAPTLCFSAMIALIFGHEIIIEKILTKLFF